MAVSNLLLVKPSDFCYYTFRCTTPKNCVESLNYYHDPYKEPLP